MAKQNDEQIHAFEMREFMQDMRDFREEIVGFKKETTLRLDSIESVQKTILFLLLEQEKDKSETWAELSALRTKIQNAKEE